MNNTQFLCLIHFLAHDEARKKCKDWGLIIRPIPVKMEGPVYKREPIEFGNKVIKELGINMDWGKDAVKNAMFVAVSIYKYMRNVCH